MKKFFFTTTICMVIMSCIGMFTPVWATTPPISSDDLDDATKEMYYEQYVEIAKEVSEETEIEISVLPMDTFTDEDWRTPNEYHQLLTKIANWDMTIPLSSDENASICTKYSSITEQGNIYSVNVTGQFTTQYDNYRQRQLFANITDFSSASSISSTQWSQIGYEYIFIDSSRICQVVFSGDLTIGGTTFHKKLIYVEFECSYRGGIS